MDIRELEAKLVLLMGSPLKAQIKIDFNKETQKFSLSVPIFRESEALPLSVQTYVNARNGRSFQPHRTSYHLLENEIKLVQEIPFEWGFQPSIRAHVLLFWDLAKKCHQMLMDISAEERLELINANRIAAE